MNSQKKIQRDPNDNWYWAEPRHPWLKSKAVTGSETQEEEEESNKHISDYSNAFPPAEVEGVGLNTSGIMELN